MSATRQYFGRPENLKVYASHEEHMREGHPGALKSLNKKEKGQAGAIEALRLENLKK